MKARTNKANLVNKLLAVALLSAALLGLSLVYVAGAAPITPAMGGGTHSPNHKSPTDYQLGNPVLISGSGGGGQPVAILRGSGQIAVAYQTASYRQNQRDIAYVETNGTTASTPVRLSSTTSGLSDALAPGLAEQGGQLEVVWEQNGASGGDYQMYHSVGSGANWTTPATISDYRVGPMMLTVQGSNLSAVEFAGTPRQPQYTTSSDGGLTWSQPVLLGQGAALGYANNGAQLANGSTGLAFAWVSGFGDGAQALFTAQVSGNWQQWQPLSDPALTGVSGVALAESSDYYYTVYCGWASSGGIRNVYGAAMPVGSSTWTSVRLTNFTSSQSCTGAYLSTDPATGETLAIATVNDGTASDFFITQAAAGSFSATQQLTHLTGSEEYNDPDLVRTAGGWSVVFDSIDYHDPNFTAGVLIAPLANGAPQPTATPVGATPTGGLPTAQPTRPTSTPTAQPSPTPAPCSFVDIAGNLYQSEIISLCQAGVISGVDATHFAPASSATRGQFIKLLMLAFSIPRATDGVSHFNDVPPNDWSYPFVEGAWRNYLVTGYTADWCDQQAFGYPCYRPGKAISRAELARMVVDATGVVEFTPATPSFDDVPTTHWAYQYVETAYSYQLMGGWTYRHFAPAQSARRDELAHTLYQALHLCSAADGQINPLCAKMKEVKSH